MVGVIFFSLGFVASLFTLLQALIILFFGLPTTKLIERQGYLKKDNGIVRNYYLSLFVMVLLYLGITFLIGVFFSNNLMNFVYGIIPTILLGLGKIGRNKDNISDFVESYKEKFTVHPGKIIETILTSR